MCPSKHSACTIITPACECYDVFSVVFPTPWFLQPPSASGFKHRCSSRMATKRLLRKLHHQCRGLDALESRGTIDVISPADSTSKKLPALVERVRAAITALCSAHRLSARALATSAAGTLYHVSASGPRRLGVLCLLVHALDRWVVVDAAGRALTSRLV